MTVVKRRSSASKKKPTLNMALVIEGFRGFRAAKNTEATAKATAEELRDKLLPVVETFGVAHGEHGQHQAIELPEPVDGYVRLVRRKNVSQFFDLDAAERLAADKGVLEDVQTTSITLTFAGTAAEAHELMRVLKHNDVESMGAAIVADVRVEQEKVYALHQRQPKVITAGDLDKLLVDDVKFSFHPEKQ